MYVVLQFGLNNCQIKLGFVQVNTKSTREMSDVPQLLFHVVYVNTCRLATLNILLINTKVPRSSKKLIAGVKEKHDKVCLLLSVAVTVGRFCKLFSLQS